MGEGNASQALQQRRDGWGPLEERGIRRGGVRRASLEGNESFLDTRSIVILQVRQDRECGDSGSSRLRRAAFGASRSSRQLNAGSPLLPLTAVVFAVPFAALHRLAGHSGKDRSCRNRQERPKKQGRHDTLE